MTPVLGYFFCLAALMPALSLDVFFGLLSKTTRQHDVLTLIRTGVEILATVTSPFRIALTVAVLVCARAVESDGARRAAAWVILGVGSILHLATLGPGADRHAVIVLLPSAALTLASFSWGSRVVAANTLG